MEILQPVTWTSREEEEYRGETNLSKQFSAETGTGTVYTPLQEHMMLVWWLYFS